MKDLTLEECKNLFIYDRQTYCSESTIQYYDDNITKFIDWYKSINPDYKTEVFVSSLNDTVFADYLIYLNRFDITKTSVRTFSRAVSVMFNWLYSHNYIDRNFISGVKLPRSDRPEIVPLSVPEAALCDKYIEQRKYSLRDYLVFHFMLDCGFRLSDVLSFNINNFDRNKKIILIRNGKYNKSRLVPVPDFLCLRIYDYFNINHSSNGISITRDGIKSFFYKLKRFSPELNRIHPHLLRHTFATSFLIGGGNIEMLRLILGHSDYTVTKDYIHLAEFYKHYSNNIYRLDSVFFKRGY